MGDRIALLHRGRLQQVDAPEAIYARPANLFVAGFIGSPKMNLVAGRLSRDGGSARIQTLGTVLPAAADVVSAAPAGGERAVVVGIRPEDVRWVASPDQPAAGVTITGNVEIVEPLGAETLVTVDVRVDTLLARVAPRSGIAPGDAVTLAIDPSHVHIFDADSGVRLDAEKGHEVLRDGPGDARGSS